MNARSNLPFRSLRMQARFRQTATVFTFLLFSGVLGSAADPATVTFSIDFPNSSPEHYSIDVQSDGRSHYESSGKISADSDVRDDYKTDFTFSDSTRARIFELAEPPEPLDASDALAIAICHLHTAGTLERQRAVGH